MGIGLHCWRPYCTTTVDQRWGMSWLGALLNSAQEDLSEGQWDSKREDLYGVDPQNWGRATTEQAEHTPFTENAPMPTSEKGAHWGCIVICQYSPSLTWSRAHTFKLGIGLSEGPWPRARPNLCCWPSLERQSGVFLPWPHVPSPLLTLYLSPGPREGRSSVVQLLLLSGRTGGTLPNT